MHLLEGLIIFIFYIPIVLIILGLINPNIGGFWIFFFKEKKRLKVFGINILLFILTVIVLGIFDKSGGQTSLSSNDNSRTVQVNKQEISAWDYALRINTVQSYLDFINKYPNSTFIEEANTILKIIKNGINPRFWNLKKYKLIEVDDAKTRIHFPEELLFYFSNLDLTDDKYDLIITWKVEGNPLGNNYQSASYGTRYKYTGAQLTLTCEFNIPNFYYKKINLYGYKACPKELTNFNIEEYSEPENAPYYDAYYTFKDEFYSNFEKIYGDLFGISGLLNQCDEYKPIIDLALGEIIRRGASSINLLHAILENKHSNSKKRRFCAEALGNLNDASAVVPLIHILLEKNEEEYLDNELLKAVITALSKIKYKDLARALIDLKINLNSKYNDGNTILMLTTLNKNEEAIKSLIEAKADVNAKNKFGATALKIAEDNKYADIVKLLKDAGAK